jgi:hypothetical protein
MRVLLLVLVVGGRLAVLVGIEELGRGRDGAVRE